MDLCFSTAKSYHGAHRLRRSIRDDLFTSRVIRYSRRNSSLLPGDGNGCSWEWTLKNSHCHHGNVDKTSHHGTGRSHHHQRDSNGHIDFEKSDRQPRGFWQRGTATKSTAASIQSDWPRIVRRMIRLCVRGIRCQKIQDRIQKSTADRKTNLSEPAKPFVGGLEKSRSIFVHIYPAKCSVFINIGCSFPAWPETCRRSPVRSFSIIHQYYSQVNGRALASRPDKKDTVEAIYQEALHRTSKLTKYGPDNCNPKESRYAAVQSSSAVCFAWSSC